MSCPQPTAQYGQTPAKAFASLILSETAAASTGDMSTPAPSAAPVAVAPPYFRTSRRERLIEVSLSPLWTRKLIPDAPDHDDALRAPGRALELHDVAGVQFREIGTASCVIADDEGLLGARDVCTGVALAPCPNGLRDEIDCDDDVAILLDGVREAHRQWPPGLRPASTPAIGGKHPRRSVRPCQHCTTAYPTVLVKVSVSRRIARGGHTSVAAGQGAAPPRRASRPAAAS